MKAKFGAIVTEGRNKIGGHVFSKNRAGSYMRTKVTPVNPQSIAQTTVRNRLATISQSWAGLSQAARNSWNSVVDQWKKTDIFGDLRAPSGFNLYQQLNNVLANCGASALTNPPIPGAVASFLTNALTMTNGTPSASLAFTPAITAGNYVIINMTAGISAGRKFVKSQYRQVAVLTTADTTPKNLLSAYTAVFGSVPSIGMKVFLQAIHVNGTTGQKGVPQETSVTIAT